MYDVSQFLSTPSARRATRSRFSCGKSADISIHALREEGDLGRHIIADGWTYFYPRPPRGGRPCRFPRTSRPDTISIHALREEGDLRSHCIRISGILFLSTPSARRATSKCRPVYRRREDFYPRPPRGGRRYRNIEAARETRISIHALREEGDHNIQFSTLISALFLSTPSARRATSFAAC